MSADFDTNVPQGRVLNPLQSGQTDLETLGAVLLRQSEVSEFCIEIFFCES